MNKKIIKKAGRYFTLEERHQIIQEYLSSQCTKVEIWEKYTGFDEEHGQLLKWMRDLGYQTEAKRRRPYIATKTNYMAKDHPIDEFENLQLKKRITELEKQLKDAEMKAIAFSTMVDIAEKEFKIPIRKKLNIKP